MSLLCRSFRYHVPTGRESMRKCSTITIRWRLIWHRKIDKWTTVHTNWTSSLLWLGAFLVTPFVKSLHVATSLHNQKI